MYQGPKPPLKMATCTSITEIAAIARNRVEQRETGVAGRGRRNLPGLALRLLKPSVARPRGRISHSGRDYEPGRTGDGVQDRPVPEPREKSANKASAGLPATLVLTLSVTARDLPASACAGLSPAADHPDAGAAAAAAPECETLLFGLLILAGVATVLLLPAGLISGLPPTRRPRPTCWPPARPEVSASWSCWPGWPITWPAGTCWWFSASRSSGGWSWRRSGGRRGPAGSGRRPGPRPDPAPRRDRRGGRRVAGAGHLTHLNGLPLLVCLGLAGLGTWLWGRVRLPVLRGWKGVACDLLLIALVLLAVPDIPIYRVGPHPPPGRFISGRGGNGLPRQPLPRGGQRDPPRQPPAGRRGFPVRGRFDVPAGRPLEFMPIDYGTLSLIDAVLSAVVFAAGCLILRMAGTGRLLGLGAMAVTVIVLAWCSPFPIGGMVQNGAIRFGLLPVSLVFFRIASIRLAGGGEPVWPRVSGWLAWAVVGLWAIWALEALLYTTATLTGLVLAEAMTRPPGSRSRWILGRVVRALIAWASFHLAFAIYILIAAGQLPDWGMYISYLRDFLVGKVGH